MHLTPHLLSILSLFAIANSAALPVAGSGRKLHNREDTGCQDNCTAQVQACVAGSINAIARLGCDGLGATCDSACAVTDPFGLQDD